MKKRFSEVQVIRILREAEAPGVQIREVCRRHNLKTYFRWRCNFGGLEVPDAHKLKALEPENAKLKRLVAEQLLAIEVAGSITSQNVILVLSRLMRLYSKPAFIRVDQGTEFTIEPRLKQGNKRLEWNPDSQPEWRQKGRLRSGRLA